jgi:restriction endonuclease S subunit
MTPTLTPYPAYKDSGVPWLGQVPEHWEVRRLKQIARLNPSKSEVPLAQRDGRAVFLPMERVGSDGRFKASEVRPISDLWNGFTYFRRGDVIVAKITPCFENGKGACLENLPTAIGFGSTEFHVIRPSKAIVSAYLYRVTTLAEFRRLGADEMTGAAGQQRVPVEFLANFPIPIPPLPEQTAIVRFLDYMDRRIRRVIRARQRQIKLLEEYRQALIHQAVTGQIDVRTGEPYAAYKDSGVPWLGQVPEHWEVRRLKYICRREKNGSTPPTDRLDYYADSGLPWYSPPSLGSDVVIGEPTRFVTETAVLDGKVRVIEPPALAVSVIGNVGRSALLLSKGATNQQITCFELLDSVCQPKFVISQFRLAEDSLVAAASSATIAILDSLHLRQTLLALPPLPEQTSIVEYLDAQTAKIDAAIAALRREIELLREYRERLIADVVTGKVDVREVAARLPEELPEEENDGPEPSDEAETFASDGEDEEAIDFDEVAT